MELPVIPYPNRVEALTGTVPVAGAEQVKEKTDPAMAADAYRLTVGKEGVMITSGGAQGAFYARQTLRQMTAAASDGTLTCCAITDEPTYAHRGFMIDCVRHFFSVDELKKMIDACAGLKMNVFHWHLTDDQGWRIQIDRYPELALKASKRPYSNFGRYNEPEAYGGWYTKEEIREIVAYCRERFIEVIPEIEMPGHGSSLLSVMPQFSCTGEPVAVKTRGGVYHDTLCIGNHGLYEVLEHILEEVMELFPGKWIHLGGDEAPKDHWKQCPKCQKMMKENGLHSEGELQCFFTNRMAAYLQSKGKQAVVWNDALRGGRLHPDITVQYWIGDGDLPVQHVNAGGKMVMSDYFHYYLDYSYGQTPLDKTYEFDPVPPQIQPGRRKDVLGVEAPIWTEYVSDLKKMAYQCFPRMLAVAETGWTVPEQKQAESFKRRLHRVLPQLEQMGLHPAEERLWNMGRAGRIRDALHFWYKAMTRKDFIEFIQHLREEKKEEQHS